MMKGGLADAVKMFAAEENNDQAIEEQKGDDQSDDSFEKDLADNSRQRTFTFNFDA